MAKPDSAAVLESYEKLVATMPGIERKGATMPYTSVNGNMFSFLTKEGNLALRLGQRERTALMEKFGARHCMQHGVVMKEYVEVPSEMLARTAKLKKWFSASVEYARGLKKKPTTRKKK